MILLITDRKRKVAKNGISNMKLPFQPNLSNSALTGIITHSVNVYKNSEKGLPSSPGIHDIMARMSIISCRISSKILTVDKNSKAKTPIS